MPINTRRGNNIYIDWQQNESQGELSGQIGDAYCTQTTNILTAIPSLPTNRSMQKIYQADVSAS